MKRDLEPFDRSKRKPIRNKNKNFFDDGYAPSKKAAQNQYKRKQKHRNHQDWDEEVN